MQEKLDALWEAELVGIQVEYALTGEELTPEVMAAAESKFKRAHKQECVKEVVKETKQHYDAKVALYAANFSADDAATPKAKTKRSRTSSVGTPQGGNAAKRLTGVIEENTKADAAADARDQENTKERLAIKREKGAGKTLLAQTQAENERTATQLAHQFNMSQQETLREEMQYKTAALQVRLAELEEAKAARMAAAKE